MNEPWCSGCRKPIYRDYARVKFRGRYFHSGFQKCDPTLATETTEQEDENASSL